MNKLKMGMLFLLLLAVLCGTMTVSAAEAPYETYVFAYDSSVQITPNAYLPAEKIAAFGDASEKPERHGGGRGARPYCHCGHRQ